MEKKIVMSILHWKRAVPCDKNEHWPVGLRCSLKFPFTDYVVSLRRTNALCYTVGTRWLIFPLDVVISFCILFYVRLFVWVFWGNCLYHWFLHLFCFQKDFISQRFVSLLWLLNLCCLLLLLTGLTRWFQVSHPFKSFQIPVIIHTNASILFDSNLQLLR